MVNHREGNMIFRIFSTMYVDWGIEIVRVNRDGTMRRVFYGPYHLSSESYGCDWEDEDGNELEEGKPWDEKRWIETIISEAWEWCEGWLTDYDLRYVRLADGRLTWDTQGNLYWQDTGQGVSMVAEDYR